MAEFKIPTIFDVGSMTVTVVHSDEMDDNFGEFKYSKAQVSLAEGLCPDLLLETFFHEAVEAANLIYELELPHAKIQILGAAIAQVIKSSR